MNKSSDIQTGNAITDHQNGWFVGHFIAEKLGIRRNDDVEIKWGVHPAGWEREGWAPNCDVVNAR